MSVRKIKSKGLLFRTFGIDHEAIDKEKRTVRLSFSSETRDVERWFGVEILDHSPGSVRLGRLKQAGPLLFNHRHDLHLGVSEDVWLENRKGQLLVRFGNSPLAEEKFQDVIDRVLVNVSCGYRVLKMVLEERGDDSTPDVFRAIDWEPYEVSLVTIAADLGVGVGRAAGESFEIEIVEPEEERGMGDDDLEKDAAPEGQRDAGGSDSVHASAISGAVRDALERERKRVADINTAGKKFARYLKDGELESYVRDETKTAEHLRNLILDRLPDEERAGSGESPAVLGMESGEVKRYSLMNALRAVVAAKNGNVSAMRKAEFEMECSREIAESLGREAKGFFVPMDVMVASAQRELSGQRAMSAANTSDLIQTQYSGMFIEALRPMSTALSLGATVLDGLEGDLEIPRELLMPTFYWIDDDDEPLPSENTFGNVKMTMKTIASAVPLTRRLLKQSGYAVEGIVQRSLLRGAALGVDNAIFNGSGTDGQPRGLNSIDGLNTQVVADPGAPTWKEIVGFETKVSADNALEGSLAYVTTPAVRGNLKTTPRDTGSGLFLMEGGECNGYSVMSTTQLPQHNILYGNFADVIVGMWGVLDVNPDTATKAGSGGLVMRVFQDMDTAIGHPQSFCKNA